MLSYINMFMVDYKTEQDALWESLDDAFPSIELNTNLADEVAELVNYLISEEASYITGQTIHLNGGLYM